MLSYPDPNKFEEIRARWETAEQGEDEAADMVGRRDKQPAQQQVNGDVLHHGGNAFRRKLSYGLSFLSNPLSQKAPARRQVTKPSLLASKSGSGRNPSPLLDDGIHDSLLSNTTVSECSEAQPVTSCTPQSPTSIFDPETTPRALPRSQTLSFIPRPVKTEFETTSATSVKAHAPLLTAALADNTMPCKIPTPSPPPSERRFSSPRQYLPHQCLQYIQPTVAGNEVKKPCETTSTVAVRSRTTPNLAKAAASPESIHRIEPKISKLVEPERPSIAPVSRKKLLQENVPTQARVNPSRVRLAQEKALKPESLAMPGVVLNKRSFGPATPLQRKQSSIVTPSNTRRQLNASGRQLTPVTARRVQSNERIGFHSQSLNRTAPDNPRLQPRFTQSRNTLTPILDISIPSPSRVNGERDNQRKTLGTPNGLGGAWRSSRALATTNHEVRKLPRSRTFHKLPDPTPPVPRVPEKYKAFSLSSLNHTLSGQGPKPLQSRIPSQGGSSRASYYGEATKGHHRSRSSPSTIGSPSLAIATYTKDLSLASPIGSVHPLSSSQNHMRPNKDDCDRPKRRNGRSWSISNFYFPESADVDSFLQVKDYMPYLYWAGRFQSRLDQWRTEAMLAELNPSHMPSGPLSHFELSQDNLAACFIFGQLRDLCTSNQAADSLWEFETRYRRDSKMVRSDFDLPAPQRRPEEQVTPKGAFGRAVRKLTPRKGSFVNLIKGKGWNKTEETATNDHPEKSWEGASKNS